RRRVLPQLSIVWFFLPSGFPCSDTQFGVAVNRNRSPALRLSLAPISLVTSYHLVFLALTHNLPLLVGQLYPGCLPRVWPCFIAQPPL
ncbi:unnamed protein product, partial [Citrullus colocynthis]